MTLPMNMPMVYVNPVTGPYAKRKWFCYVCDLGSAPVLTVFIRRNVLEDGPGPLRPGPLPRIQDLVAREGNRLQSFVVILSKPDDAFAEKLRTLARDKGITVPLTLLPEAAAERAIYKTLPVQRGATYTAILYRGREIIDVFPPEEFDDLAIPDVGPDVIAGFLPTRLKSFAGRGQNRLEKAASDMVRDWYRNER